MSKHCYLVLAVMFVGSACYGARDAGRSIFCKSQIAAIVSALDMFETDCGRYPTVEEGLAALIKCPSDTLTNKWQGPYLSERYLQSQNEPPQVSLDPWGEAIVYRYPGVHNTNGYDLYSMGADRLSITGGEDADDIASWGRKEPWFSIQTDTAVNAIAVALLAILGVLAFRTRPRH